MEITENNKKLKSQNEKSAFMVDVKLLRIELCCEILTSLEINFFDIYEW